MIDAHDFTRWVRTQDTRLAPVLQGLFDLYIRSRDNRARTTKPENADTVHTHKHSGVKGGSDSTGGPQ